MNSKILSDDDLRDGDGCATEFVLQPVAPQMPSGNMSASLIPSAFKSILHFVKDSDCQPRIGGRNIVLAAQQTGLNRTVAVKIPQRVGSARVYNKAFAREAMITAILDHPGVVPVYAIGSPDSDQGDFYAMRWIDGHDLGEWIRKLHDAPPKERLTKKNKTFLAVLKAIASACNTLHFAHSQGIVHCDVKPSNIMLGDFDETLVVDWEMAFLTGKSIWRGPLKELSRETASDGIDVRRRLGTLPYMSPEQAKEFLDHNAKLVGPSSDIYALGATLFHALTGEPPYSFETGQTQSEMAEAVAAHKYNGHLLSQKKVPAGLAAICVRAMSKLPEDRYHSARELSRDIENFLTDEPVIAERLSLLDKSLRYARRHYLIVLTAVTLTCLTALSVRFAVVARTQKSELEKALGISNARQKDSLASTARLIASHMSSDIDRRYLRLKNAAEGNALIDALRVLKPANNEVVASKWQSAQNVLEDIARSQDQRYEFYAWFVCLNDGNATQIARYPTITSDGRPAKSIGKSFSVRDYWYGLKPKKSGKSFAPTRDAYLSRPFHSDVHNVWLMAITVPIFDPDSGEVLGVLGEAVLLGHVTNRNELLQDGQLLTVAYFEGANTPPSSDPDAPSIGLAPIVQHDYMGRRQEYLTPFQQLDKSAITVVEQHQTSLLGGVQLDTYQDPFASLHRRYSGEWSATAVEVPHPLLKSAGKWVAIVQERKSKGND